MILRYTFSRLATAAAVAASLAVSLSLTGPVQAQQPQSPPPLTHAELQAALSDSKNSNAPQTAEKVRAWFGAENLKRGPNAKVNGLNVAWAIEATGMETGKEPTVVSEDGKFMLPLRRIGDTDVYAAATTLPEGAAMRWSYRVGGETRGDGRQLEVYNIPPEETEQPGVPKGTVTQQASWKSAIFPNTTRDWWVYVPAQYKPEQPACVMVFQDGSSYRNYVPRVFDNMIHKGEIPVTVGIFINPGSRLDQQPGQPPRNRSFEYDTLSDQYARFLLEEILPEVEKTVKLRQDPESRAICGASSGGICAFTVAWQRPDAFRKVVSWIGSFVNLAGGESGIAGGHNYPPMIRRTQGSPKPIRVFLQDGANDLDNRFGNWPLANQEMVKALQFGGYDYRFVYGNGFHSHAHGRAIFPDTLRWLWQDYKPNGTPK